jgi:putative transposase
MIAYASGCAPKQIETLNPPSPSWIVRVPKRPKLAATPASMGGKRIKGRKRQFMVDSLGLLLGILVHSAEIYDGEGGEWLLNEVKDRYPALAKLFVDNTYRGQFVTYATEDLHLEVEIGSKPKGVPGFVVLPQRWKVERSIAWAGRNRRLSKDFERLPESSEAFIYLAFISLMLKRLYPYPNRRKPYAPSLNKQIAA